MRLNTKKILFLFFLFLVQILFCQIKVNLIEPVNGAFINFTPITFSFNTTNTTALEELKNIDPNNLSCLLVIQLNNKIIKQGPLYLPLGEIGQFEYTTFPANTYIWSVQCNGIPSEYRVLIVSNKSYEEYFGLETSNQSNFNKTKENKTTEKNNLQQPNPPTKEKNTAPEIYIYLATIALIVVFIFLFYLNKNKQKAK